MRKKLFITIMLAAAMLLAACASKNTPSAQTPTGGGTPDVTATAAPTDTSSDPASATTDVPTATVDEPTDTPVPTTEPTTAPIASDWSKESLLSGFEATDQKGLYVTRKMSFPWEEPGEVRIFSICRFGDALAISDPQHCEIYTCSPENLGKLNTFSYEKSMLSRYINDDFIDENCLCIKEVSNGPDEKTDIYAYTLYDSQFNKIAEFEISDFKYCFIEKYDREKDRVLLMAWAPHYDEATDGLNDGIYEYDLKTGMLNKLFTAEMIEVPEGYFVQDMWVYNQSDNELYIYADICEIDCGIPSFGYNFEFSIVTSEVTKLPDNLFLGYRDEGSAVSTDFESDGGRFSVGHKGYYDEEGPGIDIYDKDMKCTQGIRAGSTGEAMDYYADWENNVIITSEYTGETSYILRCYSMVTGDLIADLKTEGSVSGYESGLVFITGTVEENDSFKTAIYAWDYLNGSVSR